MLTSVIDRFSGFNELINNNAKEFSGNIAKGWMAFDA
jgi:hypothetical protein